MGDIHKAIHQRTSYTQVLQLAANGRFVVQNQCIYNLATGAYPPPEEPRLQVFCILQLFAGDVNIIIQKIIYFFVHNMGTEFHL